MAKARGDFTDILVRRQVLSPDQLDEARGLERQAGMKLPDAIVKLGYASPDQVMSAVAEHHGLQFVDLTEVTIPPAATQVKLRLFVSGHGGGNPTGAECIGPADEFCQRMTHVVVDLHRDWANAG